MTIEKNHNGGPEKLKSKYRKAVRIFPFAPVGVENLVCQLEQLFDGKVEDLSTLQIYLGQRKEEKRLCPNMLSPYGGLIDSQSNFLETAYLKLIQETELSPVPFPNRQIRNLNSKYKTSSYQYYINQKSCGREVCLVPTPCLPVDDDQDTKPSHRQTLGFSSQEFQQLISEKHHKFIIEGHLTFNQNPEDITIEDRQRSIRDQSLKQISKYFSEMDQYLKKRLAIKIKAVLPNYLGKLSFEFDLDLINPEIYFCEFYRLLGNQFWPILRKAYHQVITEIYMSHFRKDKFPTDTTEKSKIFNHDSLARRFDTLRDEVERNHLGVDILHYLPIYSLYPETVPIKSSRSIVTAIQFMRKSLDQAMTNNSQLLESQDFITGCAKLEQKTLQEKHEIIRKLDNELLSILSRVSGMEVKEIVKLWLQAQRFIPDFANELKAADPELLKLYQFHEPLNEIISNSISGTLFLAFDNQKNDKQAVTLRFEAARQLALFLKLLLVKPIYDQKIMDIPNPLDLAINHYFGGVNHTEVITLTNPDTGMQYDKIVEHRCAPGKPILIIDEKPIKGIVSYTRKSFETRPVEIHDIYSVGVVLPEKHSQGLSSLQKITMCQQIRAEFINFLHEQFPDAVITFHEAKNNYSTIIDCQRKHSSVKSSGTRTGSQSSKIIREKFVVELTMNNKSYYYELVFYPFETLGIMNNGLLGWREKIQDDPTYGLRRTLLPLKQSFGLRSFYELLFPPEIYSDIARQRASVLQKKPELQLP